MMRNEERVEHFLYRDKANRSFAGLADLLREHFPDSLPKVGFGTSGPRQCVASVLVNRNRGEFNDLLPAIAAVYSQDNVSVQAEMRQAFEDLLSKPFDATKWKEPLWGALAIWGNESIGHRAWRSTIGQDSNRMSFVIGLFLKPDPEICSRLDDFRRMGVDLDAPIDNEFGGESVRFSALSYAVAMRSSSVVGHLLAHGCSVDRLVRVHDGKSVTAMSMAMDNAAKPDQNEQSLEKSTQICSMLQAALAKKHAMLAIAEMAGDVQVELAAPARR